MSDCILVVGLGSIGRRHARVISALRPDARIVALRRSVDALPDDVRVTHQVTTIDEALLHRPRAAVIATPATMHLATGRAFADAGVHLLIEKPIADQPAGVETLIAACRRRDLVLMTGYNLRFSPSLRAFRERVRGGDIGRILSVRADVGQYLPSWRPGSDYRRDVSARADLGGGVLRELSHEIDYLRWVFGDVSRVSATLRRQSDLEIDVEDTASLTLEFADGNRARGPLGMLSMDFTRRDLTRVCTAVGAEGTLQWDAVRGQVRRFAADASDWEVVCDAPPERDATYRAEWEHFFDCIETGRPPMITGDDGLAVLHIIDAARRSADTLAAVTINEAFIQDRNQP
jgi:predicted dehydrogenase